MSEKYRWDKLRGLLLNESDEQSIQLVGGTNKFRKRCGRLLADALNADERRKENLRKWTARAGDGRGG